MEKDRMQKYPIGLWGGVSVALALITAVSALVVVMTYGVMKVPVQYGPTQYDVRTETIYNWAIIVGCAVSVIYACLFAVVVCAAAKTQAALLDILLKLGIAKKPDGLEDLQRSLSKT